METQKTPPTPPPDRREHHNGCITPFIIILMVLSFVFGIAANSQNVHALYFGIDCPSNNIESFYEFSDPDTINTYALWVEEFNGSTWDIMAPSYTVFPIPVTYYSFISITPVIDNSYRLVYQDLGTLDEIILDTVVTTCGNFLGIENESYSTLKTIEYYTFSGQNIKDIGTPGIYLEVSTFGDNRQTFKKIYKP